MPLNVREDIGVVPAGAVIPANAAVVAVAVVAITTGDTIATTPNLPLPLTSKFYLS